MIALSFTCADYVGHPFSKSETCTSTISLASHLAFTKRDSCQEDRDQASHSLMSTYAPLSATRQKDDARSSFAEEKRDKEHKNMP
jgi:hypothetical protein